MSAFDNYIFDCGLWWLMSVQHVSVCDKSLAYSWSDIDYNPSYVDIMTGMMYYYYYILSYCNILPSKSSWSLLKIRRRDFWRRKKNILHSTILTVNILDSYFCAMSFRSGIGRILHFACVKITKRSYIFFFSIKTFIIK